MDPQPTNIVPNVTDPWTVVSEICLSTNQIATHITRVVIAVAALYLFAVEWIHYCRNYGCYNARNHLKLLTETILISVSITLAFTAAVGSEIYVTLLMDDPSTVRGIPWSQLRGFFYAISLIVCYTVLWFRQRTFYTNTNLVHLTNGVSRVISKYFIVYIILSGLAMVCGLVVGDCKLQCYRTVFWAALTTWPLSIQLILLWLMVFPLYKHHTTNLMSNKKLVTLMKRAAIFTALCSISDLVTLVLHLTVCILWTLPLELNMIVNVTCVTLIPCNWKERFAPWLKSNGRGEKAAQKQRSSVCLRKLNASTWTHEHSCTQMTDVHTEISSNDEVRSK